MESLIRSFEADGLAIISGFLARLYQLYLSTKVCCRVVSVFKVSIYLVSTYLLD